MSLARVVRVYRGVEGQSVALCVGGEGDDGGGATSVGSVGSDGGEGRAVAVYLLCTRCAAVTDRLLSDLCTVRSRKIVVRSALASRTRRRLASALQALDPDVVDALGGGAAGDDDNHVEAIDVQPMFDGTPASATATVAVADKALLMAPAFVGALEYPLASPSEPFGQDELERDPTTDAAEQGGVRTGSMSSGDAEDDDGFMVVRSPRTPPASLGPDATEARLAPSYAFLSASFREGGGDGNGNGHGNGMPGGGARTGRAQSWTAGTAPGPAVGGSSAPGVATRSIARTRAATTLRSGGSVPAAGPHAGAAAGVPHSSSESSKSDWFSFRGIFGGGGGSTGSSGGSGKEDGAVRDSSDRGRLDTPGRFAVGAHELGVARALVVTPEHVLLCAEQKGREMRDAAALADLQAVEVATPRREDTDQYRLTLSLQLMDIGERAEVVAVRIALAYLYDCSGGCFAGRVHRPRLRSLWLALCVLRKLTCVAVTFARMSPL